MLNITGGKVFDPANGIWGDVRDVWLDEQMRVCPPALHALHETLDASGCAVMAGAIDIHSHIAGEPLNLLRESGDPIVPTVHRLGADYVRMGYTLAANAAMPALGARRTLLEEHAIPGLDTLNLTWVGENPALCALAAGKDDATLDEYLCRLLSVSCGWGLKLINPRNGTSDGELPYEKLIDRLIEANERLSLPHPLHLHHPFLARTDAYQSVVQTIERAAGRRLHLAHLQFYGYKSNAKGRVVSAAEELAAAVNAHENVSVDAGAVVFGKAAAVTADAGFAQKLGVGKRGFRSELWELDGGFGVLPLSYAADNVMGATQFITGLELLLLIDDPSRIFLTTDHPNGGPFTAYPYLLKLLMDKDFRDEELSRLNPRALSRSGIREIKREYSLSDIACMTRSAPAKRLGLETFGHLGIGAAGGAVVYRLGGDLEEMFASPAHVFRPKPQIHALAERPFDADRVKKQIAFYGGGDVDDARPNEEFLARCGVLQKEHVNGL